MASPKPFGRFVTAWQGDGWLRQNPLVGSITVFMACGWLFGWLQPDVVGCNHVHSTLHQMQEHMIVNDMWYAVTSLSQHMMTLHQLFAWHRQLNCHCIALAR